MENPTPEQENALISQFCAVAAGVQPHQASEFLAASGWDLEAALAVFYAGDAGELQDNDEDDSEPTSHAAASDPTPSGPVARTLDGRVVPVDPSTASSSKQPQRGMRTLKDMQNASAAGGHAHGHDHDDDDDDEEGDPLNSFAGGEKSGLAVQNPGQSSRGAIQDMIRRAGRDVPRPGGEDSERPRSNFTGRAQTLGGDDVPSQEIPDPHPQQPRARAAAPETREFHIWNDGFSIDDGDLYRYDDPANRGYIEQINRGQAPMELMSVHHGQEVDVQLNIHKGEDFVRPKKKYKPFSGQGQRLGSPTPGSSSSAPPPPVASTSSTTQATPAAPEVNIDSSQPTITLQIRLGDGTRLRSNFNTTHTIGDVYGFVTSASPASTQRSWVLMTTFPSKELTDKAQSLGDLPEFKRGGVVVQKWT